MTGYSGFNVRKTPQSEPVPGRKMVKNAAGGYAFRIGDWERLARFLILGSEQSTYYASAKELTIQNAQAVLGCLAEDGHRVIERTVEVSESGRAPKNDPALFVLAMAMKLAEDEKVRRHAGGVLPLVARTGTHLFHFVRFMEQMGGWGRMTRAAVSSWYNGMDAGRLAYQMAKYKQRDGWSHRDVLRLAHPKPVDEQKNTLYRWATQGLEEVPQELGYVWAAEQAKRADVKESIRLIEEHGLTWEMLRTEVLRDKAVWDALLVKMPLTAMVRNLGRMTANGLLDAFSDATGRVCGRLRDGEYLKKSRVHPLSVLVALRTYASGKGVRGRLTWNPVAQIVDALDDAFYLAFGNVETSDNRTMLALDVSGSMDWGNVAGMSITPREAVGAMALVTARTEPRHCITAFSDRLVQVVLSPRQRLDDVIRGLKRIPMGGTDCSLPMVRAMKDKLQIDLFVVYTDNETWAGRIHPFQALKEYRQKSGINAKLIVVGMTATEISIADPSDGGMLDVVGFDTASPQVIADFGRGRI